MRRKAFGIWTQLLYLLGSDLLMGLVVKASASRAEEPGFESRMRQDFSGVESNQ